MTDPEYGNAFFRFDLSGATQNSAPELTISITYNVTRKAYRVLGNDGKTGRDTEANLIRFLAPDRFVPIGGKIAVEAWKIAGHVEGEIPKARHIYDHIRETINYDKTGKGWGKGDANYACDIRRGNCTDFHSLFIGELRSLSIPARFIMGIPLLEKKSVGKIPGYHCWAEFYVQGKGWIPVDASEARKHPEKKEALFGGLDAHRVEFTIGRDIELPGASASPLNYFIYPHVEVDGRVHEKVLTILRFKDLKS
jgi:transglutaminase-like putative cysteine protease